MNHRARTPELSPCRAWSQRSSASPLVQGGAARHQLSAAILASLQLLACAKEAAPQAPAANAVSANPAPWLPPVHPRLVLDARPAELIKNSSAAEWFDSLLPLERRLAWSKSSGIFLDETERLLYAEYPAGSLLYVQGPGSAEIERAFRERQPWLLEEGPARSQVLRSVDTEGPRAFWRAGTREVWLVETDLSLLRVLRGRAEGKLQRTPTALKQGFWRPLAEPQPTSPLVLWLESPQSLGEEAPPELLALRVECNFKPDAVMLSFRLLTSAAPEEAGPKLQEQLQSLCQRTPLLRSPAPASAPRAPGLLTELSPPRCSPESGANVCDYDLRLGSYAGRQLLQELLRSELRDFAPIRALPVAPSVAQ